MKKRKNVKNEVQQVHNKWRNVETQKTNEEQENNTDTHKI